jgi:DNA invertase Pin-like site-specific DNA recombinase
MLLYQKPPFLIHPPESPPADQARIEAAKKKGVYKGRKPSVPVAKAREMREAGQGPTAIAKTLGISRMSVHRALTGA